MRLDEQCNEKTYKVGVMYCRAGQQTEEEMYNNEEGGPAFNEFLDLLGQRVRLKGFNKYKAGLCNKSKFSFIVHIREGFKKYIKKIHEGVVGRGKLKKKY